MNAVSDAAAIGIANTDAKINPSTPKYVFVSNFSNKYSINFDTPTIPINMPNPNTPPTIIFWKRFSK